MLNIDTQYSAIKYLANRFEIDEWWLSDQWPSYWFPDHFLDRLQDKVADVLQQRGDEYFYELDDAEELRNALLSITYSELACIAYGIDYNLELRRQQSIVSEENYGLLHRYLVALPSIRDEGLVGEDHGHGYHIHYVLIQQKKQKRSNIVLTFNPAEVKRSEHSLYWEHHGSGLASDPERFGARRRQAVYDTSCGFLSKIQKSDFRKPSAKANLLWPI